MNGQLQNSSNGSAFMLGALINSLALSGMSDLVEYSVKAVVGGCIWLSFKILSDYISERIHQKSATRKEEADSLEKIINP